MSCTFPWFRWLGRRCHKFAPASLAAVNPLHISLLYLFLLSRLFQQCTSFSTRSWTSATRRRAIFASQFVNNPAGRLALHCVLTKSAWKAARVGWLSSITSATFHHCGLRDIACPSDASTPALPRVVPRAVHRGEDHVRVHQDGCAQARREGREAEHGGDERGVLARGGHQVQGAGGRRRRAAAPPVLCVSSLPPRSLTPRADGASHPPGLHLASLAPRRRTRCSWT